MMFQVDRMDRIGLPAVTMPQLLTVSVPAGRFPENRLRHGQAVEGQKLSTRGGGEGTDA